MLEAIGAGAAGSWQLDNLGPKIVAHDWRPGFFIKLIRKDLRLVAEAARERRAALPGLSLMQSMFDSAAALGHELDGTQAVAAVLDSTGPPEVVRELNHRRAPRAAHTFAQARCANPFGESR